MVIGIIGLVVLGGWFGWQWLQSRKGPEPLTFATPAASLSPNPDLAGLQTDDPPWDAALGSLRERLEQLGLPVLTAEDLSLHFHVHLDVRVDGKTVAVPDDIGRNEGAGYITVIHTHTEDGIIHIESPKGHEYTLGQVFNVWGVQLNEECLGGLCNEGDQKLRVYADGELLDPAEVRLLHSQLAPGRSWSPTEPPIRSRTHSRRGTRSRWDPDRPFAWLQQLSEDAALQAAPRRVLHRRVGPEPAWS